MAYNVCDGCGTNLNHILGLYELEMENFRIKLQEKTGESSPEQLKYFNNLFFLKHNIDRLCCRTFFISFLDYVPSNM